MPTYSFYCPECDSEKQNPMEVSMKFSDYDEWKNGNLLVYCAICGGNLDRILDCSEYGVFDRTPKTVGTLSERNTKELGKYGREAKREQRRIELENKRKERQQKIQEKMPNAKFPEEPTKPIPKWAMPDMSLNKLTPAQKQRYILEGKK